SKYVYHYTSVPRLRQVFLSGGYLDPKLAIPEEGTLADAIYGFGVVLFFSPVPLGDIGRMNFGDDAITLEFDRDRLEGARFNEQDYTTYNRVPLRGLTERSKREVLRRLGESFRDALGYYGPLYDESAEIIAEPAAGPGVDYSLEPEELAEVRSHVQSGGTITVVRPDDAYPTT